MTWTSQPPHLFLWLNLLFQAVDMAYFLIIMVIFMLAYGIAQQAILHPQQEASVTLLSQIFFRPYFQIYGELFLEDPEQSKNKHSNRFYILCFVWILDWFRFYYFFSAGNETTIFGTEVHDSFGGTLVTLLTAWYLLVANILLLNLLIAIFKWATLGHIFQVLLISILMTNECMVHGTDLDTIITL